jgi:DNA-binding CsgD family transcriptional regulator
MANNLSSKQIDEALERLNALSYPPAEDSAEFKEILQCYENAGKRGYKKGRAAAAGTICRAYIAYRHFSKLAPYLKEMKALCEENGTWHDMYFDCLLMGIETDSTFGNFEQAVETANVFLSGLINTQTGFRANNAYMIIGNLYQMRGWHIRAMRVFHQGMARRDEFKDLMAFPGMWCNYAFSLFCVKQYDDALKELNALMESSTELPPMLIAHCHLMLSQIHAQGYADYDNCMKHTNLSLAISRKHGIRAEEAFMQVAHGLNLTRLKRYKEALPVLQNKLVMEIVGDNPNEYAEILNAEAECLLHLGKIKEANQKMNQVKKMLDMPDLLETIKAKYYENYTHYYHLKGDTKAMVESNALQNAAHEQSSRIEFAMQLEQVNAMMELDKKKYELEVQQLKHESMQKELSFAAQEKEMLQAAIDQRNALINEFQVAIKKIEKSDMKRAEIFNALNEKISSVKNSNTELNEYDLRFNKKHKEYSLILGKHYPQLTAAEVKVAIMLASGLSNKEIASITLTTTRNVENHRLQMRKKMKLKQGEDLIKILAELLN